MCSYFEFDSLIILDSSQADKYVLLHMLRPRWSVYNLAMKLPDVTREDFSYLFLDQTEAPFSAPHAQLTSCLSLPTGLGRETGAMDTAEWLTKTRGRRH